MTDVTVLEKIPLYGRFRKIVYNRDYDRWWISDWSMNRVVNNGKDNVLKSLGGLATISIVSSIGVGDSTQAPADTDNDLVATTNKLFKTIQAQDIIYTRPTLLCRATFDYGDGNWVWNEVGIKTVNGNLMARQVDSTPLNKTSVQRAIMEWLFSL